MNKLYMIPLMIAFLAVSVSAIGEGDNLTQQQINNINFDTANLACRFDSLSINPLTFYFEFGFSCLSLQQVEDYYSVFRTYWTQYFPVVDYISCRLQYPKATCVSTLKTREINEAKYNIKNHRQWLKQFQTQNDLNNGDINITEGDLN